MHLIETMSSTRERVPTFCFYFYEEMSQNALAIVTFLFSIILTCLLIFSLKI
jgi:hypothetical protein